MTKPTPSQIDDLKEINMGWQIAKEICEFFEIGDKKHTDLLDYVIKVRKKAQQEFHTANCPLCTHEIMEARREERQKAQSELLDGIDRLLIEHKDCENDCSLYRQLEELRKRKDEKQ
jgi:hypothetical protein